MKSEIARKILDATPKETREKVREYADKLIKEHQMKTDNQQPSRLLTEADLKVGNRFECIEAVRLSTIIESENGKIIYIKGETYECEYGGCITDHLYNRHRFWNKDLSLLNRHFKLSHQPQEDSAHVCKIKTGLDFLKEQQEFKNQSEPQEEVTEEMTAEKLFLSKYGNKITASESWVIRFAEDYANQKTLSLQQENKKLSDKLNVTQKVFEDVFDKYVKLLPDDSLAKLIETLKSLTK